MASGTTARRAAWVAIGALAAAQPARADAPAEATALFDQGIRDLQAGNTEVACKELGASLAKYADSGTKGALATCETTLGKVATAWQLWRDLADTAPTPELRGDAAANVLKLEPRLPHFIVKLSGAAPPGLVVSVNGVTADPTLGVALPIDPGAVLVTATAPDRVDATQTLQVAEGKTLIIEIAPLVVRAPVEHQGTLHITAHPLTAQILIDGTPAGTGHADAVLKPGGHTLRVVADGMRAYQAEVQVGDSEERSIDVPLEKDLTVFTMGPSGPSGPSFELGGSIAPGVKLHNDRPRVIAYRVELARRIGRRNNFGLFVEAGSVDPNSGHGACGTDLPGSKPASPFDFGARNQFASCNYVMPGLQFLTHILPGRRFDPYIGIALGFRMAFMKWTPFDATGAMQPTQSDIWPGAIADIRTGLDYHPTPRFQGWQIGVAVSIQATGAQETPHGASAGGPAPYVSLFGGLRSTIQF